MFLKMISESIYFNQGLFVVVNIIYFCLLKKYLF